MAQDQHFALWETQFDTEGSERDNLLQECGLLHYQPAKRKVPGSTPVVNYTRPGAQP
jgi:hypothetical protein